MAGVGEGDVVVRPKAPRALRAPGGAAVDRGQDGAVAADHPAVARVGEGDAVESRAPLPAQSAPGGAAVGGGEDGVFVGWGQSKGSLAVSYTHLTLPTIL